MTGKRGTAYDSCNVATKSEVGSGVMPQLRWDEVDFLTWLEVEPKIDEFETGHHYSVSKDGLRLELSVFQFLRDIWITVYRDGVERPVVDFRITDCSGTRYVNDPRGEYLEFAPAQVFGDRFQRDFLIPAGVRLSVKPSICIKLFTQPT
jgi:hypothetical protein